MFEEMLSGFSTEDVLLFVGFIALVVIAAICNAKADSEEGDYEKK